MSKTILAVDDEFGIPELIEFALQDEGYRVVTATNGRQGLERLAEEPVVDLVLLDFMMPVLDGPGMLEAMRDGARRDVPVIFMSSVDEAAVRERCGNTFQGFLLKPFSLAELSAAVRKVLGRG